MAELAPQLAPLAPPTPTLSPPVLRSDDFPTTPGGTQKRVSWSRELVQRPSAGADNGGLELMPSLEASQSLPELSASSTSFAGNSGVHRGRNRAAKRANRRQRQQERAYTQQPGSVAGHGLPRISAPRESALPRVLQRHGGSGGVVDSSWASEHSTLMMGIMSDASGNSSDRSMCRDHGELDEAVSGREGSNMFVRQLPEPVMYLPTQFYNHPAKLKEAEETFQNHRTRLNNVAPLVNVKTPDGYRNYHALREGQSARQTDGLSNWLGARQQNTNYLAPLGRMTMPKSSSSSPPRNSPKQVGQIDHFLEDFYSQVDHLEYKMAFSPSCVAHKVMARLNPSPVLPLSSHAQRQYDEDMEQGSAASTIQSRFRGRLARRNLQEQRMAAGKIQASYRGRKGRKKYQSRQAAKRSEEDEAAARIQAIQRGRKDRRKVASRQKKKRSDGDHAASKIQAIQRGKKGRRKAEQKRASRKNDSKKKAPVKPDTPLPQRTADEIFAEKHQKSLCTIQAARLVHAVAQRKIWALTNGDGAGTDEQTMHDLALSNAVKADSPPPPEYTTQKKKAGIWGKMVAKIVGNAPAHLPAALHLRHFATRRVAGNGAMLLTTELIETINLERLLDPELWGTGSIKGSAIIVLNEQKKIGEMHGFSKINEEAEGAEKTPWQDTMQLEVANTAEDKLFGFIALDESDESYEKKIGTFEVPLRSLKDGVATDHWVPVHRAASILHLKVTLFRGDDSVLKLMVDVHDAFNLENTDASGLSDPYCKVSLGTNFPQRTKAIAEDLSPQWEEAFVFEVDEQLLQSAGWAKGVHPLLQCTVFDQDILMDDIMASFALDIAELEVGVPKEFYLESADIMAINAAIKIMKNKKLAADASMLVDKQVLAIAESAIQTEKAKPSRWSRMFGKSPDKQADKVDTILRALAPKPSPMMALLKKQRLIGAAASVAPASSEVSLLEPEAAVAEL